MMISFPEFLRVNSLSKQMFDNFDIFEFENSYKKRAKTKPNYIVDISIVCTADAAVVAV